MRIVSLLPAATEIVWALGLGDDLVGVSHGCDFPPDVAGRPVLTRPAGSAAPQGATAPDGATARDGATAPDGSLEPAIHVVTAGAGSAAAPPPVAVDHHLLATLGPDLLLVPPWPARHGEAGDQSVALRDAVGPDATIVTLDPTSIEGVFHAIATIGAMTEAEDEAVGLVEILRERLADVEEIVEERREEGHAAPRVVALDWLDPPLAAGLWVPEQVRRAGGWELIGSHGMPSVPTAWQAVIDLDPEMLLLAPCGMHLAQCVRSWRALPRPAGLLEIQAVRRGQVFALDGSAYFSRPGPRLIDGIELLAEIFDPAAFVDLAPAGSWVPVA